MRGSLRASARRVQRAHRALALALGVAGGCFHDDFLLGAYCARDGDCGDDQCCAGLRCRPEPDHCERAAGSERPYPWAYLACADDEACVAHGMPRCVFWRGAARGFCSDFCIEADKFNCEIHPKTMSRTCVTVDEQLMCAIDCSRDPCPAQMACHEDVCVPAP